MTDQPGRIGSEGGNKKDDPTALTLDLLQREIAQLFQLVKAEMATITQSIHDQDKLHNAQLAGVQQQLTHAESLRKELKADNEKNIDRLITGVERATEKLESSMTRTLAQVVDSNKSDSDGLRRDIDALKDRINDNKERVGGLESLRNGVMEGRQGMSESLKLGMAMLGSVLLLIGYFAQRGGP